VYVYVLKLETLASIITIYYYFIQIPILTLTVIVTLAPAPISQSVRVWKFIIQTTVSHSLTTALKFKFEIHIVNVRLCFTSLNHKICPSCPSSTALLQLRVKTL